MKQGKSICLTPELWKRIEEIANAEGVARSVMLSMLVVRGLKVWAKAEEAESAGAGGGGGTCG